MDLVVLEALLSYIQKWQDFKLDRIEQTLLFMCKIHWASLKKKKDLSKCGLFLL